MVLRRGQSFEAQSQVNGKVRSAQDRRTEKKVRRKVHCNGTTENLGNRPEHLRSIPHHVALAATVSRGRSIHCTAQCQTFDGTTHQPGYALATIHIQATHTDTSPVDMFGFVEEGRCIWCKGARDILAASEAEGGGEALPPTRTGEGECQGLGRAKGACCCVTQPVASGDGSIH